MLVNLLAQDETVTEMWLSNDRVRSKVTPRSLMDSDGTSSFPSSESLIIGRLPKTMSFVFSGLSIRRERTSALEGRENIPLPQDMFWRTFTEKNGGTKWQPEIRLRSQATIESASCRFNLHLRQNVHIEIPSNKEKMLMWISGWKPGHGGQKSGTNVYFFSKLCLILSVAIHVLSATEAARTLVAQGPAEKSFLKAFPTSKVHSDNS